MGSKVKTFAPGAILGGTLGVGATLLGNKGKSDYDSQYDQYRTARPDMTSNAWMKVAEDQQAQNLLNAQDSFARQSEAQLNQARAQLASRGGLRQGAAERLATQAMNNKQIGLQGVNRDAANALTDLKVEGAKFTQDNLMKEYFGNRAAMAQLDAGRGKGGKGGLVGGLGQVTGK